jgi:uncharacterized membrane protein
MMRRNTTQSASTPTRRLSNRDFALIDQSSSRLNEPTVTRRMKLPRPQPDTFGRFAESFARFMGTAQFIFWMSVFIALWVLLNVVGPTGWQLDRYPFQFLTLLLSLQASYAAPLILLAQNRQEQRDRVSNENDRRQVAQSRADTDYLAREIASLRMRVGELATRDFIERLVADALQRSVEEQRADPSRSE